jgi:hypothetical protein
MMIGLEEIRDERTSDFWWQIKSPIFRSLSMDINEQQQFAKRDTLVSSFEPTLADTEVIGVFRLFDGFP